VPLKLDFNKLTNSCWKLRRWQINHGTIVRPNSVRYLSHRRGGTSDSKEWFERLRGNKAITRPTRRYQNNGSTGQAAAGNRINVVEVMTVLLNRRCLDAQTTKVVKEAARNVKSGKKMINKSHVVNAS
jgi:hypothetical protein